MCAGETLSSSICSLDENFKSLGGGGAWSGRFYETILSSLSPTFFSSVSCAVFPGGSVLERFISLASQQDLKGCSPAFQGLALVSACGLSKCFKDCQHPRPSGAFFHARFKIKALRTVK